MSQTKTNFYFNYLLTFSILNRCKPKMCTLFFTIVYLVINGISQLKLSCKTDKSRFRGDPRKRDKFCQLNYENIL